MRSSSWIATFDPGGQGLRIAVKDMIDLAGLPTTAASRVVARTALPAATDAACMAGIRAAEGRGEARVVGKTSCNELAFGVTGLNPWYPSPVNPLDPDRVVGGSSSGSAAAVGHDEADVALGTDTGGSIRIPAACCGVAGLKTTAGRVPTTGVRPLAASLDTVGPIARDVAGLVAGMALLEEGFVPTPPEAVGTIARVRLPATPAMDAALDAALATMGLPVVEAALPGWDDARRAGMVVLGAEAWEADGHLAAGGGLSPEVADRLWQGRSVTPASVAVARAVGRRWASAVAQIMEDLGPGAVLAMPTLSAPTPTVAAAAAVTDLRHTMPWNLAGWPALALPIPLAGDLPTSLQLVAGPGGEELLLAAAGLVEAACRTGGGGRP